MKRLLWAALLAPVLAFAGQLGDRPGTQQTAASYTSSAASGAVGFKLKQGAIFCYNSTTCTQTITSDSDGLIFNAPTGDDHSFKVNATDAAVIGATNTTFAGSVTSSAAAAASAFIATAQAKYCVNATCTAYMYENASGELAFYVSAFERFAVTGGVVRAASGFDSASPGTGFRFNGANNMASGTATPEAAVTDTVGGVWLRTNGDDDTALYLKTSGSGNTGWKPVATYIIGTAVIDFPDNTGTFDCDTSAVTVTGAALGDTCELGISVDMSALEGTFSCEITGADAAVAKHCGTGNPGSATYTVRVSEN